MILKKLIFLVLLFSFFNIVYSTQSNVSSGFNLTYQINTTTSPYTKTIYDFNKDLVFPVPINSSQNANNGSVTYKALFAENYPYKSFFKLINRSDLTKTKCKSSSNLNDCIISYNSSSKPYLPLVFKFCSEGGGCGVPPLSYYFEREGFGFVTNGLFLNYIINFNISSIPELSYVYPTPENNQKNLYNGNMTIKFYDGNRTLDGCFVNINDENKTMNYNNSYCSYTYQINKSTNIQAINFQGFFNFSGTIYSLEKRTVYIYPFKDDNKSLPGFGLGSFIVIVLVLLGGLIIK